MALPGIGDTTPQAKRWTREEYYRLGEQGWFLEERVELIDGEILVLTPQSSWHAYATDKLASLLEVIFSKGYWIRAQLPLPFGELHEPEPDISVVRGQRDDFIDNHPTEAQLVVEVSLTTIEYDKNIKPSLYARMGVPDYWVLDLENRLLLVYRQPAVDENAPFGHRYKIVETIPADGCVSPFEKPDAKLAVADMLPPKK
ncbi:MAG: Uma2 family endonuclease [Pirellulales bacterium]|nr:Uma2 family endonuclease [Pirellulales bacterium]